MAAKPKVEYSWDPFHKLLLETPETTEFSDLRRTREPKF
jgi:hypothetical protein